jgi:hypothetical protein
MKKIAISFGLVVLLASTVSLATVPNWDIKGGTWALDFLCQVNCGGHYYHTMAITAFDRDTGIFSGTGTWNDNPVGYTWTVTGKVSGNAIDFKIVYTGQNAGYYSVVQGTIDTTTSMSGSWESSAAQSGTWTASGLAVEIPYKCVKIKEGVLKYSAGHYLAGQPLVLGYDAYGYNYQAHIFDGSYANAYLGGGGFAPYLGSGEAYDAAYLVDNPGAGGTWYWPYRSTRVLMKWNDAWLSNLDCNGDWLLDRHYGYVSYKDSGAWETNHMWDSYTDSISGTMCTWNWFTKIVAAPEDATLTGGYWYNSDGTEIGTVLWGEFATIMSVYNDPCAGYNGVEYLSPAGPGFGKY